MPVRVRAVLVAILTAITTVPMVRAQAPAERLGFEVASIKPNRSDSATSPARLMISPGDRVMLGNLPMTLIVGMAFEHDGFSRVLGQPDWMRTERFDVNAKASAPTSAEQLRVMLQTLLADRCQLVVHHETRDNPIYALVLNRPDGRLGPNMHPAADCTEIVSGQSVPSNPCGTSLNPRGSLRVRGRDMGQFALLRPVVGRRVVDRTGLSGVFDTDLTWIPQFPAGSSDPTSADANGPTIFTAMQEQLGLKLVADKEEEDVVVIDHVERPTED